MKVPSRKAAGAAEQRHYDLQAERAKTSNVRDAFPEVNVIHVALDFTDPSGHAPSPQRHSLYPAARAFFRFACPCADCDGDFNLSAAVTELVKVGTSAKPKTGRAVTGRTLCHGTRWRDSDRSEPCRIELTFEIIVGIGSVIEEPGSAA